MSKRGFALVKGTRFAYSREVNGVHQFVSAQQSQWSPVVYVHIYLKGDLDTPGYVVGGRLGNRGIEAAGEKWIVSDEAEARTSFESILQLLDRNAMPYFAGIRDLAEFKKVEEDARRSGRQYLS